MEPTNPHVMIPGNRALLVVTFALFLLVGADSQRPPLAARAVEPDFMTATISVTFDRSSMPRLTAVAEAVSRVTSRPYFTLADLQRLKLPDSSGKTLGDVANISVSFRNYHSRSVLPAANETVFDACGVALELLKAKQYSDFLERFMMPERLSTAMRGRESWNATVDSFSGTRAGKMLAALEEIRSWRKTDVEAVKGLSDNDASDESIVGHSTNSDGHREKFNIPFRRFEGVWYIVGL